ncbi:ABC transporter substrate-binding protein [Bifidobacterium samirii]|uniref:Glycine/betaine ABC transporter substrate-binding protein n=1 Tax=Bifidobacterium samirii TaxID=2306974 RepID=A0A430FUS6_9BIFI|nr:ABC transporter substrate-binding protein [Bifidobacterium samirii]RSX57199.1 glycine/betaine ABC transporter substrate-binding protein [Bifidobacterium samirii]
MKHTRSLAVVSAAVAAMLALAGCGSTDPFAGSDAKENTAKGTDTIVVGSANFSESEIIARIYTEALKDNGIDASVKANIGSREVYLDALEDGSIDMIPEYTGNLLQFYDESNTASAAEDVYAGLADALPKDFEVLDMADAQDADAFYIQRSVADAQGITTIGDLKKLGDDLKVAAPPEFSKRVYGIEGLRSKYGLTVSLVPVNDGGGQSTVQALLDGQVDFARLDSTSPLIAANDLVRLEDDQQMILAQNVVPVAKAGKLDDKAKAVIDKVQAKLTTEDLMSMNAQSVNDKKSAQDIAEGWLDEADLF